VGKYFAGLLGPAPKASAHYGVDRDEILQYVLERDIAWHAPGVNHNGIGVELAGYASQGARDWADDYSAALLARSAELVSALCATYKIPVTFVEASGLLDGDRGITTHAEVSRAFKLSNHTDPGTNFPMTTYLQSVASR
jgi:N-acetyl-anhydromuramyl-L-alanine amidase AmpD